MTLSSATKSRSILKILGITITLLLALMFLLNFQLRSVHFYPLWIVAYSMSAVAILLAIQHGNLLHPSVIIGSSYWLILIVGSLTYTWLHHRSLLPEVFNLVAVGFVALMGGIYLGETRWRSGVPILTIEKKAKNASVVYVLACLGILASVYLFINFKGIPLLAANPNDAKVRFLVGNGIFNLFFKGLPVFAMALLYIRTVRNQSLFVAHAYCAATMVIVLAAGYRSTTLISLGEYVCLYLILHQKKIQLRWAAWAIVGGLAFLAIVGSYRRGNEGFIGALNELAIVVQARPALFESIVRNFDGDDFFKGSLYYNDFKRFLPGLQTNANVDLKYAIFPNAESMPDIAGVTPSVAGEAYMNFGSQGVFWILLMLGFSLGIFYRVFLRYQNFMRTSTYLTFVFGMAGGVQSGIGLKLIHLTQFWFWTILLGILLEYDLLFQSNRRGIAS